MVDPLSFAALFPRDWCSLIKEYPSLFYCLIRPYVVLSLLSDTNSAGQISLVHPVRLCEPSLLCQENV